MKTISILLVTITLFLSACASAPSPTAAPIPTTPAPVFSAQITDTPKVSAPEQAEQNPAVAPMDTYFPTLGTILNWQPDGDILYFTPETLFEFMNGQAEGFFVYGFQQLSTQTYRSLRGQVLRLEIYEMGSDADAYGIFASARSSREASFGNGGSMAPGQRITFWQERFYVQVISGAGEALTDEDLQAFAGFAQQELPKGGKLPAILGKLPLEGQKSNLFFRQELSIQNDVWLGGENLINLSSDTLGALGRYEMDGQPMILILVEYPQPDLAGAAAANLSSADLENLCAWQLNGNLLSAAFGENCADIGKNLVDSAVR